MVAIRQCAGFDPVAHLIKHQPGELLPVLHEIAPNHAEVRKIVFEPRETVRRAASEAVAVFHGDLDVAEA
jgi:hypothetical protein